MRDRLVTADASRVSGADFARACGLNIRTPEQKEAEWQAMCERAADAIENGLEDLVSPVLLRDARRIVAEREQLTETRGDPFGNPFRANAADAAPRFRAPHGAPADRHPSGFNRISQGGRR